MPRVTPSGTHSDRKYSDEAVGRLKRLLDRLEPGKGTWVMPKTESEKKLVGGLDYENRLEKRKYQSFLRKELDKRFETSHLGWAKKAVVFHKLVAEEIDYHSSGSHVFKPSKVLEKRTGDCQDQSVLLANLYHDSAFKVRIYDVSRIGEDAGHALPLVKLPKDNGEPAYSYLRQVYRDIFNYDPGEMGCSFINGETYFVADPIWCDYLGDIESLKGDYIHDHPDSWDWNEIWEKTRITPKIYK
jgi:hypothetical protein